MMNNVLRNSQRPRHDLSFIIYHSSFSGGMTLLLVVLLLAIFLSIAAGTFQIAFTEYRLSGELSDSFQALYAADEGVERLFFYDRVLNSAVLGCSAWGACTSTPQTINLGNGICVELRFSRDAAAQTAVTAVGEFRCGGSAVAVRRALEATYQKELNFGAALVAFWTFDWGAGESAPQNVEDVVSDDRTVVEANDGMRGSDLLPGGDINDPNWINPSGGPCTPSGNCALKFDGTDDYVSVPDAADGSLDPSQITIAAWVRIPLPSGKESIVSKGANAGYRFRINNNRTVTWSDRGATNEVSSNISNRIDTDTWTHIAVTGDASGLKIYINGSLDASNLTAYGGPDTNAVLRIGAEPAVIPTEYFNGCIDNVKIWSTALSASEVQADHDSYVPGASC